MNTHIGKYLQQRRSNFCHAYGDNPQTPIYPTLDTHLWSIDVADCDDRVRLFAITIKDIVNITLSTLSGGILGAISDAYFHTCLPNRSHSLGPISVSVFVMRKHSYYRGKGIRDDEIPPWRVSCVSFFSLLAIFSRASRTRPCMRCPKLAQWTFSKWQEEWETTNRNFLPTSSISLGLILYIVRSMTLPAASSTYNTWPSYIKWSCLNEPIRIKRIATSNLVLVFMNHAISCPECYVLFLCFLLVLRASQH